MLDKAAVIGVFDGVHIGHLALIEALIEKAGVRKLEPMALTFDPVPSLYFNPHFNFLLSTREEKEARLLELGIKEVVFLPFSEVVDTGPEQFIEQELDARRVDLIVVGEGFRFGRNRGGSVQTLKKKGNFDVIVLPKRRFESEAVSATRIRELLLLGHIHRANHLLGYEYTVSGSISKGLGRAGALLDTPTVNIEPGNRHKLAPPDGIYAVRYSKEKHPGVCYIGSSPTFGDSTHKIEVHLLDRPPEGSSKPQVSFVARLRPDMRFSSVAALKKQVREDTEQARRVLCQK
ncbi:riboflavin biosynthesis protein RibF [candidate division WOR-3 bacterium]|nr:riboflavin biosynthesis protein RibF [candidate division WOR-3 bacterium]